MNDAEKLKRLLWFFRMIDSGGPDGSDLDTLVYDEAREAADAWDAELDALAAAIISETGEQKP